jgi:hypothetical protein
VAVLLVAFIQNARGLFRCRSCAVLPVYGVSAAFSLSYSSYHGDHIMFIPRMNHWLDDALISGRVNFVGFRSSWIDLTWINKLISTHLSIFKAPPFSSGNQLFPIHYMENGEDGVSNRIPGIRLIAVVIIIAWSEFAIVARNIWRPTILFKSVCYVETCSCMVHPLIFVS